MTDPHKHPIFPLRMPSDMRAEVRRAAKDETNTNISAWLLKAITKDLRRWRKQIN